MVWNILDIGFCSPYRDNVLIEDIPFHQNRIDLSKEVKEKYVLDLKKERDAHIDQRLRNEAIIWLSTVRPDGRPHLVPVWFLWEGQTILVFSMPNNQKIRNIRANNNVSLALEALDEGGDVVIIEGEATLLNDPAVKTTLPAYVQKYRAAMQDMGSTPEAMAKTYSQAIRITPTNFKSWS